MLKNIIIKTTLATVLLSIIFLAIIIIWLEHNLPSVEVLKDVQLQVPLKIYSKDGKLIAEYGDKRRTPLTLDQVPKSMLNAILATEDKRFYEHYGVDLRGILRAAYISISQKSKSQGGSTITMQVARNFFLTRKKTYIRKISEILLSLKIEKKLSKNEILELYINKIYLGKHAYGIAAAAEVYYGTTVDKLTLAQQAMIAGLPKAPSTLNPINSPDAALKRRSHVLTRMLEDKQISQQEYEQAMAEPIITTYHKRNVELYAPYVAEMVRQKLVEQYGEQIYDQGYEIITTIDSELQIAANEAVTKALSEYEQRHNLQSQVEGALVALEPANGAVLALVGGADYERSKFNRAIQAERQPGSAIKPFIYSAALEQGFTLASIINDAPIVEHNPNAEQDWRPQNYTKKFYGPTRLRVGVTHSRNLISIRLLKSIGIDQAINFLVKCGFKKSSLPRNLTLALGTNHTTLLEFAASYSIFPNGGYLVQPHFIEKITNYQGETIFSKAMSTEQKKEQEKEQVISSQTAYLMTSLLQEAITSNLERKYLNLGRKDLAGKTGTTNDYMDGWYAGYNKDLVVTTWMGFDEPRSLREYAVNTALPMWVHFMKKALHNKPDSSHQQPDGIITVRIDPKTGLLAHTDQTDGIYELFVDGTAPTTIAPRKYNIKSNLNLQESESIESIEVEDLF